VALSLLKAFGDDNTRSMGTVQIYPLRPFLRQETQSRKGRVTTATLRNTSHTLRSLDYVKIIDAINKIEVERITKGYAPADINRLLQGIIWSANSVALRQVGGQNAGLKTLHNAGQQFLQIHLDALWLSESLGRSNRMTALSLCKLSN